MMYPVVSVEQANPSSLKGMVREWRRGFCGPFEQEYHRLNYQLRWVSWTWLDFNSSNMAEGVHHILLGVRIGPWLPVLPPSQ